MSLNTTMVRRAVITICLVALAVFPLVSNDLYYQTMLILTFLIAIGATGWNIMGGYAGDASPAAAPSSGSARTPRASWRRRKGSPLFVGCFVGRRDRGRPGGDPQPGHQSHPGHVLHHRHVRGAPAARHRGHHLVQPHRRKPGPCPADPDVEPVHPELALRPLAACPAGDQRRRLRVGAP